MNKRGVINGRRNRRKEKPSARVRSGGVKTGALDYEPKRKTMRKLGSESNQRTC